MTEHEQHSMSDAGAAARNLRERLSGGAEDRLGRAIGELLENPLLSGAIGRAFDAREKAVQAQEAALGALNIPSAADIERLTRRLRSVSQRLEGIEDGVARLERSLSPQPAGWAQLDRRLEAIEQRLAAVSEKLDRAGSPRAGGESSERKRTRAAKAASAQRT